ncbi:TrbG/VirB9 family P-type conjugative transfer protein [Paraburkholderia sp. CNPSo 3272]|uniref:TrbG/VirB9 family P-type conjugative transfer protein n=1 Tax=Paraburkholderia sp. CNPSo 3272 TaxID=2940931 RepID=UPI0020B8EAFE|nr:TrbG/VirB9 family P-type conjugative transfer protein [Paraburkholderia sp. CNPSo 3272]MCP3728351.1 TrbG/VirB9 family P-type conjugative transfer protein [Paraburkholderia sp. CNPSo 3272]
MTIRFPKALAAASIAAALFGMSLPAVAEVVPGACGSDRHIACAVYDPNETYRIAYRPGEATVLVFEKGEKIDGGGMGDGKAWTAGPAGNGFFFKPKAPQAATNLILLTNRRRYVLKLVPVRRHEEAVWSLTFDYPDTRAKASAAAAVRSAEARALLAQTVSASGVGNFNYDMHGDTTLAPTALWDDGRFTYFEFRTSRDLPQIYRVYGDGKEALVNPDDMRGPVLVVHDTAERFNLRVGDAVLGIRNNAYRPDGQLNPTGTTIPGTVRLVKQKEAAGE